MYISPYVTISENDINLCTIMHISVYTHTLNMHAYLYTYLYSRYRSYRQVHVVFMRLQKRKHFIIIHYSVAIIHLFVA